MSDNKQREGFREKLIAEFSNVFVKTSWSDKP